MKRSGWILAISMVFCILIAGCIGTEEHNQTIPSRDLTQPVSNETYWIHLDSITDKHINDTFVITGTTNLPEGELLNIILYPAFSPHTTKDQTPVFWGREYIVSIFKGPGGQNTFATKSVSITPSESGETYEDIRVGNQYLIKAQYIKNNSVQNTIDFQILAPEASIPSFTTTKFTRENQSAGVQDSYTRKSPVPFATVIFSLILFGLVFIFLKGNKE